jgi:hypothetical protein
MLAELVLAKSKMIRLGGCLVDDIVQVKPSQVMKQPQVQGFGHYQRL